MTWATSVPFCSQVRPDVRDKQTDRRQTKASFNVSALWGGGIMKLLKLNCQIRKIKKSQRTGDGPDLEIAER